MKIKCHYQEFAILFSIRETQTCWFVQVEGKVIQIAVVWIGVFMLNWRKFLANLYCDQKEIHVFMVYFKRVYIKWDEVFIINHFFKLELMQCKRLSH